MTISNHDKSDYFKSPSDMLMNYSRSSGKIEFGGHDLLSELRISYQCCYNSRETTVDVDLATIGRLSLSGGSF